jgi:hypothetical protein
MINLISPQSLEILIRHNLITLPVTVESKASLPVLATILNNISYYGYALSEQSYQKLSQSSDPEITKWWQIIEPVFGKITGDDRNMADFVVYKNFPQEVLAMSEAEYWFKRKRSGG